LKILALIGMASFMLSGLLIGARLLWLGRRTKQLPELAIGTIFLLGPLGFALLIAARAPAFAGHAQALVLSGGLSIEASTAALFVVTWSIYRSGAIWARTLCGFGITMCAATFVSALVLAVGPYLPVKLPLWMMIATGMLAYGWCSFEGIRYSGLMKRRLRLGLTDPELAHRFQCWAMSSTATLLLYGLSAANRALSETGYDDRLLVAQSALGLFAALVNWLTFFPPAFYRARLLRGVVLQES
jgi:hypothetical protein